MQIHDANDIIIKNEGAIILQRWGDYFDSLLNADEPEECPCMNCEVSYIGETGRKFSIRLEKHKTEVEKVCRKVITRARRKNLSPPPCHRLGEAKVIGTETGRFKRWVKEAIEIRKRGSPTMNCDEGQYHLSHIYGELLLNKMSPIRKSTGNSKTFATKITDRQDELSVIHVSSSFVWIREYETYLQIFIYRS